MKLIKSIVPIVLIFTLIFSAIGPAFADYGYMQVHWSLESGDNESTLHVGDTVYLTVLLVNTGPYGWSQLKVYAPIPYGLKYESFIVPDKQVQDYNPENGIWNVIRMEPYDRGAVKELIITTKVLPEAEGREMRFTASFYSLELEGNGTDLVATHQAPIVNYPAVMPAVLTDIKKNNTPPVNQTIPQGNRTGNQGGNHTGNGIDLFNSSGNTRLADIMKNFTTSQENEPLKNIQTGGSSGKTYEISMDRPQTQDNPMAMYILAILLIAGLLVTGYFYGIRRDR